MTKRKHKTSKHRNQITKDIKNITKYHTLCLELTQFFMEKLNCINYKIRRDTL